MNPIGCSGLIYGLDYLFNWKKMYKGNSGLNGEYIYEDFKYC